MPGYPKYEEVATATQDQLVHWYRFLPPPGWIAEGKTNHREVLSEETKIKNLIASRFTSKFTSAGCANCKVKGTINALTKKKSIPCHRLGDHRPRKANRS